jgi:hypothetical protein
MAQGASGGPGNAAGDKYVKFTRASALRIGKAVRVVERGDRNQPPVRFEHHVGTNFRLQLGTFTGAWFTGTYKTVTLTGSTNTAAVYNWTTEVETGGTCPRRVIFGRLMGTLAAVEIQLQTSCATCVHSIGAFDLRLLPNYSGAQTQVLGHNASACLQWYSVTTCSTT